MPSALHRFLLLALLCSPVCAQTALPNAPGQGDSVSAPAASRPVPAALKAYVSCKLPIGPNLLQYTSLPQAPMTRAALTLTGRKEVKLMDGLISAYGFTGSAPFANVKVELLPASTYLAEKADLISEFDAIHAKGEDTERNLTLKPTLNGFEIYGFDRKALDGKVLGIYLFFDNLRRVATTAYFLNAPETQRKFTTVAEYDNLREGFLNAYTVCVRKQLSGGAPARSPQPVRKLHQPARR